MNRPKMLTVLLQPQNEPHSGRAQQYWPPHRTPHALQRQTQTGPQEGSHQRPEENAPIVKYRQQEQLAANQSDVSGRISQRIRPGISVMRAPQYEHNQQNPLIMLENPLAECYHPSLDS